MSRRHESRPTIRRSASPCGKHRTGCVPGAQLRIRQAVMSGQHQIKHHRVGALGQPLERRGPQRRNRHAKSRLTEHTQIFSSISPDGDVYRPRMRSAI